MAEDDDENEDWLAGGTFEARCSDTSFFAGQCVPIDTSRLPEPPEDPNVA